MESANWLWNGLWGNWEDYNGPRRIGVAGYTGCSANGKTQAVKGLDYAHLGSNEVRVSFKPNFPLAGLGDVECLIFADDRDDPACFRDKPSTEGVFR